MKTTRCNIGLAMQNLKVAKEQTGLDASRRLAGVIRQCSRAKAKSRVEVATEALTIMEAIAPTLYGAEREEANRLRNDSLTLGITSGLFVLPKKETVDTETYRKALIARIRMAAQDYTLLTGEVITVGINYPALQHDLVISK